MIVWRTSRFLLLFFLMMLAILGIAGATVISQMKPDFWREPLTAIRSLTQEAAATPVPSPGPGRAVALPRYPVVQVHQPAESVFDPAG